MPEPQSVQKLVLNCGNGNAADIQTESLFAACAPDVRPTSAKETSIALCKKNYEKLINVRMNVINAAKPFDVDNK